MVWLSKGGTFYLSRLKADGFEGSERHVAFVGELSESADDPATQTHKDKRGKRVVQCDSLDVWSVLHLTLWH